MGLNIDHARLQRNFSILVLPSIEGRRNKCTFKYEITKSNVLSWDDPVWLTGRASYRESKGPEFEPSPRKREIGQPRATS